MRILTTICLAAAALAAPALGQSAILVDIENPTLAPGQSTTVTLWAAHAPSDFAIARVDTDLLASTGSEGLSAWALTPPLDGPGTTAGAASPAGIEGIRAGQLNFPPAPIPDPANPIAFWSVTYTAPMDVAAPFDVLLSTRTGWFDVYPTRRSTIGESRLDLLVEGQASIRVVPAPAGALALVGLALATHRRR